MGDTGFPGGTTVRVLHGGEGGVHVIELQGWFPEAGPSCMGRHVAGPSPFKRKLAEHQSGGGIYKESHDLNMKGGCQALREPLGCLGKGGFGKRADEAL